MVELALNQVTAARLNWQATADLARRLGCSGVELRNDLGRPLFEGADPRAVREGLAERGISLYGVAEISRFNAGTAADLTAAEDLIAQAAAAGARGVALIPAVGSEVAADATCEALKRLAEPLAATGLLGFVEPIGFPASSLRRKEDALDAIAACGNPERFALIHDTFHHHLAGENAVFAGETAIIHISGVPAPVDRDRVGDSARGLVDAGDGLGTVAQVRALMDAGFEGPVSVELFDPAIQHLTDYDAVLAPMLQFFRDQIDRAPV